MKANINTGVSQDQKRRREIADELFRFHAAVNRIVAKYAEEFVLMPERSAASVLNGFHGDILVTLEDTLRKARE